MDCRSLKCTLSDQGVRPRVGSKCQISKEKKVSAIVIQALLTRLVQNLGLSSLSSPESMETYDHEKREDGCIYWTPRAQEIRFTEGRRSSFLANTSRPRCHTIAHPPEESETRHELAQSSWDASTARASRTQCQPSCYKRHPLEPPLAPHAKICACETYRWSHGMGVDTVSQSPSFYVIQH